MRILIVEDADERIKWFKDFFGVEHILDVTKDANEAIAWLEEGRTYAGIFLDHDLSDAHYALLSQERTEFDEFTGHAVACWLAGNPQNYRGIPIVIHSLNAYGRLRMQRVLVAAGYSVSVVPFTILCLPGVLKLDQKETS